MTKNTRSKNSQINDSCLVTSLSVENLREIIEEIVKTRTNELVENIQCLLKEVSDLKEQSAIEDKSEANNQNTIIVSNQKIDKKKRRLEVKIPERQKNTQQRQSIVKKKQKNAIIGNGDADLNFAGAARRIWLHLGREFIIESLSHDTQRNGSFKIGADMDLKDILYSANFWPKNPYCVEMHAEFCGVEVPRAKTIIITVYRPSTSRHFQILLDKLEEILSSLATRTNYLVLIGDFIKDILIKSAEIHALLDLAESFGLKAKIMDPTRVSKWTATTVDNIITDLSDDSCSFGILEPGLSDHSGQYICLHAVSNIVRNNYYFSRPVNDMGLSKLRDHLISVDWLSMQTNCDVNTFATYLVTTYQRLIKLCFPLKKRIISNKCTISWFNDDLRRMRDSIAAIKIISDCTQDLSDKKAYQQARSLYKKSIMNAKQNAYSSYIAQSDNIPKDSWRFINCLRNKNKNNSNQKNTKFDANEFNSYFSNIADEILKGIDKTDVRTPDILLNTMPKICNNFFLEPTCDNEISNIINNLKNSNCTDVYGINSKILKETVSLILTPLTNFFNECLGSGVFPDSLKFSKIIPIQKKGDAALLDNYRPIIIIPIFGKVLEILIKSRLTKYFEKFRVINEAQFGFRSGKATTQALLRVMELVVDGLENSEINMVTLCDLSKAFDCVSHTTLMTKLEFYGVRGIPHKLFSSYLSNRKQCSAVNNMQSAFTTVKHGVPQGSVLGPLLFIIYTNDFYNFINKKANCVLYADDTSLITSDRCINSLLNKAETAQKYADIWFASNSLKLNKNKTQEILNIIQ
ncbi:uncharacterized protein LOC135127305 [Zophobas morio]|uniref:uncharacterized protein LOC135127305 n=1 Tax=Zophobas morio TaxID=2755281 RepID=UPI003082ED16